MDFRPRQAAEGDLTGRWRATPADFELKRVGADADLDDSGWQNVDVPGHWGQIPELDGHDGPILYRHRFDHRPVVDDERLWLRFDGVLSGAEIWLDGTYVGDTTSYFASQRFDVTKQMADGGDHLLAVEVSCPPVGDGRSQSSLTGSLQSGHLAPPGNPGGIWRDVAIDSTGPVAVRYARLMCTKANTDEAQLMIRLVLDAADQTDVRIDTSIVGPDGGGGGGGGERHSLASGENRIEWTVPIVEPQLWWPAALGPQPLYDVAVAVRLEDGTLTDRREWRTGLRRVSVDNFIFNMNGQRLFAKGIAVGPSGRFLSAASPETITEDMQAVRDAGLDLVRVFGHVARDELYTEADRLGLMVWQDLPLVGGYSSKVRSKAKALARAAVDHLGHHPSVMLWCAHSEPNGQILADPGRWSGLEQAPTTEVESSGQDPVGVLDRAPLLSATRRIGRHLLPSWNRSFLDPVIARELRNADHSRPVVVKSGTLPSPADLTGSDSHLWLGWHGGHAEDLGRLIRRWPRLGAFLGGIGTQSVSDGEWGPDAPQWATAEQGAFARYLPRSAYPDGRSWSEATRAYQADVLRIHIETLRRLKYRPAGGFCVTALADTEPEGGFGVLDYDRRPKPAHNVLIDACRPVVVVADPPPALTIPGQAISMAVHVVSDRRRGLGRVRVTGHAHGEGNDDRWQASVTWEGDVPGDSCIRVGSFDFEIPPHHGKVVIDLQLVSEELIATNRYRTVVIPPSETLGHSTR